MRHWPGRRWAATVVGAIATILVVAVPTAVIPTPWFGREIGPTAWAWPVIVLTGVLSGLLTATYVALPGATIPEEAPSRSALVGGVLAYLAVGCPVCNKIALLALGASGAIRWFAPVQPWLAAAGIVVLGYALRRRLAGERACPVRSSAI